MLQSRYPHFLSTRRAHIIEYMLSLNKIEAKLLESSCLEISTRRVQPAGNEQLLKEDEGHLHFPLTIPDLPFVEECSGNLLHVLLLHELVRELRDSNEGTEGHAQRSRLHHRVWASARDSCPAFRNRSHWDLSDLGLGIPPLLFSWWLLLFEKIVDRLKGLLVVGAGVVLRWSHDLGWLLKCRWEILLAAKNLDQAVHARV